MPEDEVPPGALTAPKAPASKKRPLRKDLQLARAEVMLLRRLAGQPVAAIAEEFGVSDRTVRRAVALARKQDLLGQAIEYARERLLPRALVAFEEALERGDVDVAKDVLQGLGVLRKHAQVQVTASPEVGGETFEQWRERIIRERREKAATAPVVLDVEVVSDSDRS